MPRDLNADEVVDAVDHSGDYQTLPVRIIMEWRSVAGTSRIEMKTILSEF